MVVDARGHPVAGALVFQSGDGPKRTRTTTDEKGRFRLDGVVNRPAFLFAQKAGFRFHGQVFGEGADSITMKLTRTDERPDPMRTGPSPLPHPEELALARRAIDAYADKVLKEGDINEKVWTLEALARSSPIACSPRPRRGSSSTPSTMRCSGCGSSKGWPATTPTPRPRSPSRCR